MASMEASVRYHRWAAVTAIAPVAWGSTYFVTRELLPADHPIYGAVIRALPAGLVLLVLGRRLPRGAWWWRSPVLGTLNAGMFFVLVYLSAVLLPTSIASTVMATAPVVMMAFAWALLGDRPLVKQLAGAGLGIAGVMLMLLSGTTGTNPLGVLVAVTAMVMSSLGFVLATRWSTRGATEIGVLELTSWQLVIGGLVLLPFAVVLEGAPPAVDGPTLLGFGYLSLVATALAFAAWFTGLRNLPAGTVGLIGLLNPVTGVLLGTCIAGETLSVRQMCGTALVIAGIALGSPSGSGRRGARPCRPGVRDSGSSVAVASHGDLPGAEELGPVRRDVPAGHVAVDHGVLVQLGVALLQQPTSARGRLWNPLTYVPWPRPDTSFAGSSWGPPP